MRRSSTWRNWRYSVTVLTLLIPILGTCRGAPATVEVIGDERFIHLVNEDGVWWFARPDGSRFVSLGINHIEPVLISSETNRDVFAEKYGEGLYGPGGVADPRTDEARRWMDDSVQQIEGWGFNTVGIHNPIPQERLPYVAMFRPYAIDGWHNLDRQWPDPFDPEVEKDVGAKAEMWCDLKADDPLILGIAFNDMPIWRSTPARIHEWVAYVMSLDRDAPGKRRWVEHLQERWMSPETAGEAYGIEAATWDDLLATTEWPLPARPLLVWKDATAFLPVIADRWYGVVTSSIRACDPHHLVLGDKYDAARDMPPWLYPLIGKHFDAAFIQWYEYADRQIPALSELHEVTGEPVLMGDSTFSFPTPDMPAPKGIRMRSRPEVGDAYARYLEDILAEPWVVGWHNCGYIDGSPDLAVHHPYFAIQPGFLRSDGTPYESVVERVAAANRSAERWHARPTAEAALAATPWGAADHHTGRCSVHQHALWKVSRVDANVWNAGQFVKGEIPFPIKNISWIVTEEGVVVIDTGSPLTGAVTRELIRETTSRPVRYIIYTHHHGTQVGGTREMMDEGTRVIAHADLVRHFDLFSELRPYHGLRDRIQFDIPVTPTRDPGLVYPDITFEDRMTLTLGSTRIEIEHVEGEASDYALVHLPDQHIVFASDLLGPGMPMVASPMKEVRDEVRWRQALERIRDLKPEVLINSTQLPMCDPEMVRRRLDAHIDYLDWLHEAVVAELNAGSSMQETLAHTALPEHLATHPFLGQGYGAHAYNVRGLYHRYSGWFDRNGTHLVPASRPLLASTLVSDMGGPQKVLSRARTLAGNGERTLALEYLDLLIDSDRLATEARILKADILDELAGIHSYHPMTRDMYLALAKLEREAAGVPSEPPTGE